MSPLRGFNGFQKLIEHPFFTYKFSSSRDALLISLQRAANLSMMHRVCCLYVRDLFVNI